VRVLCACSITDASTAKLLRRYIAGYGGYECPELQWNVLGSFLNRLFCSTLVNDVSEATHVIAEKESPASSSSSSDDVLEAARNNGAKVLLPSYLQRTHQVRYR
jgi:hypothetical protein